MAKSTPTKSRGEETNTTDCSNPHAEPVRSALLGADTVSLLVPSTSASAIPAIPAIPATVYPLNPPDPSHRPPPTSVGNFELSGRGRCYPSPSNPSTSAAGWVPPNAAATSLDTPSDQKSFPNAPAVSMSAFEGARDFTLNNSLVNNIAGNCTQTILKFDGGGGAINC